MTEIQWTDETWNPLRGCSKVSAGCRECYAEKVAARFSGPALPYEGTITAGRWNGTIRLVPEKLDQPLRWTKPRMVFVNSMSDLFHEEVSNEYIAAVFGVMAASEPHTFQVLTKRPARMLAWFEWLAERSAAWKGTNGLDNGPVHFLMHGAWKWGPVDGIPAMQRFHVPWPLPNVWLGVSAENQETADERIPLLLQCPAAVRWVSAEPLLGAVDLGLGAGSSKHWDHRWVRLIRHVSPDFAWATDCPSAKPGIYRAESNALGALSLRLGEHRLGIRPAEFEHLPKLDWVVVGGESGRNARPCDAWWIEEMVEQCQGARVPIFVKQLGTVAARNDKLSDNKGGDPAEWPRALRVREWPASTPSEEDEPWENGSD